MPPESQSDFFARQAGEAFRAGQAALQAGDLPRALHWLERAVRLAPEDAAAALALAGARLRAGDAAAARPVLERVAAEVEARDVLLLLAVARLRTGGPAREAMGRLLSGFLVADAAVLRPLADEIAGPGGWCAVAADGTALSSGPMAWRLDGRRWGGGVVPAGAQVLEAGAGVLGSPIDLRRARRVEGVVEADGAGGLRGWAWRPGDPDADPVLEVVGADGRGRVRVVAADQTMAATGPLARPRRFAVGAAALAALARPVGVVGEDGVALAGSPLDPDAEAAAAAAVARAVARRFPLRGRAGPEGDPLLHVAAAAGLRGAAASAVADPGRAVAVVVPVYRGLEVTRRCLEAVRATVPDGVVVVVDDASPEPALAAWLDGLDWVRLLRHRENRGFPAAANAGLRLAARLAPGADMVLLNSDAVVTPGWVEALRVAVHAAGDVGTATPLSNDATILSYPRAEGGNPAPRDAALLRIARQAAQAGGAPVEVPTAVGFCMYIRRECLAATGLFREDVFAQGYGEENDFCIRARHLGWRHVGVPGVYVAHEGGASFGAASSPLVARNLAVLERLHPGYAALIAAFQAADPLMPARRRLDMLRWRAGRKTAGAAIMVTHDSGGGVERVIRDRAAALRRAGRRAILLRPVADRLRAGPQGGAAYRPGLVRVDDDGGDWPNLVFAVPGELDALAGLLRGDKASVMEVHHLLGHTHALLRLAQRLGVAEEAHLHDYAWFCPRVTLLGPERRYCGEPEDPRVCDACVADAGSAVEETLAVAALRARSARDLARARRVVAPSADGAARLRRHFPALRPEVAALEDDAALIAAGRALPRLVPAAGRRVVAVIGGIGAEKGYDVLLACARDAAWRDLMLEFVVVGHSADDRRLIDTGRVRVTGTYREGEGEMLVRAQNPALAFLPSVWPETWCFTLGVAWRAGLRAAVFDIGAPAERVRATGHGWVLPLGLPAGAINNALLALPA